MHEQAMQFCTLKILRALIVTTAAVVTIGKVSNDQPRTRQTSCSNKDKKAVLSQGEPRDAAVNIDTYRILQRHRAVSLPQHRFLVGLYLQTTDKLVFCLKFSKT